jgi:hypothetical protein
MVKPRMIFSYGRLVLLTHARWIGNNKVSVSLCSSLFPVKTICLKLKSSVDLPKNPQSEFRTYITNAR